MHPVGFEPTTSAGERPQTYALDRSATGTGMPLLNANVKLLLNSSCEGRIVVHVTEDLHRPCVLIANSIQLWRYNNIMLNWLHPLANWFELHS